MTTTATTPTRSEKADAITVILYAAVALITVGLATVLRVGGTFRETGSRGRSRSTSSRSRRRRTPGPSPSRDSPTRRWSSPPT
ncbi:hypothetical protein [Microbacterium sp. Se63.02b]|uniref:hypothetical protein n=1 Tax=Microbacterium sp. Se63.02b TaxID=2709304 RepID=UPI00160543DF|nr:hypothetical protein [Microbacterium sp. Se63.02b]QNA93613.1 hypothetical protein G4G29_17255 [Microbacterium sp. Se63.02b]